MTDHGSIPLDSNFDFKFILAWTGCSSTFWRLPVARNQGRLLRPQALLHFSNFFFCLSSWEFFNFLLLHPTPWLTVKEYFLSNFHPFTAYFFMQRYSKDHFMQLKLGNVSTTELKNHYVYSSSQKHRLWESFMVTHYNWLFTIWWAKVPEEIIFQKNVFVNSSRRSQY